MGKNQQISQWFILYSDAIYQFLLYRIGSSDVEDLVQEVYIRAIKSYDSFNGTSSPKTWLYSIARHVAIDEIRKKKRNKWKDILSFNTSPEPKSERTPEYIVGLSEENSEFIQAIYSLNQQHTEILILRGISGLSTSETAQTLHWTENKVRSTFHRAKRALREQLGGMSDEE